MSGRRSTQARPQAGGWARRARARHRARAEHTTIKGTARAGPRQPPHGLILSAAGPPPPLRAFDEGAAQNCAGPSDRQGGEARPGEGGAAVGGLPDQDRPAPGDTPTARLVPCPTVPHMLGGGQTASKGQTVPRHCQIAGS